MPGACQFGVATHSHTTTAPVLHVGQRIDKYVVRGPLAAGTWARVFEAQHERLGSDVAIKVLSHADEEVTQRFEREAQTAAKVRHRNVLEVYDVGNLEDGTPYLVMELLRGHDLAAQLEQGPLPIDAVVDLGRQLAAALVALADAAVVHRDIKPQNVVLHHESGEVVAKIVDFGVSKPRLPHPTSTDRNMVVGTPYYMSPEQLRGGEVDGRADLYSVGVVLYESLTGRPPFTGASLQAVAASILHDPVPRVRERRPDCPRELEQVVMRMLAKDQAERHASPRELAQDLERIVDFLELQTGANAWDAPRVRQQSSIPAPAESSTTSDRTGKRLAWLAVLVLVGLLGATAWGWIGPW